MELDLSRAQWRKSSYSGNSGNCVEIAYLDDAVAVRDSTKLDGSVLMFSPQAWRAFTSDTRDHHLRTGCWL
jgi:hypothetical protein